MRAGRVSGRREGVGEMNLRESRKLARQLRATGLVKIERIRWEGGGYRITAVDPVSGYPVHYDTLPDPEDAEPELWLEPGDTW